MEPLFSESLPEPIARPMSSNETPAVQRVGQANAGESFGPPGPRREFSFRKTAHQGASSQVVEVHRRVTPRMRPSIKAHGKLMERTPRCRG